MNELIMAALSSFGLGIMTTLHPCPFASNLAAISLIAGWPVDQGKKIRNYIGFTSGYVLALLALAFVLNLSIVSVPVISLFLQKTISGLLGPLLILAGMVITGLIKFRVAGSKFLLNNIDSGHRSALYLVLIGSMLALTFCPATASVFFGILIPLSIKHEQIFLFPVLYALGTALPIIVISMAINRGLLVIPKGNWISQVSRIAGWMLIILGIYITVDQIYL